MSDRDDDINQYMIGVMSKRDWFAGQALVYLNGYHPSLDNNNIDTDELSRAAYEIADAMLKASK